MLKDIQIAPIAQNTTVLRSRTWERLKFEVEYGRQKGTTANSFLIQAERTALIDPPGESFTADYCETLSNLIPWESLDFIIVSHVNPNRMTTLVMLMDKAPQAQIVCTKAAAQALKATFSQWENRISIVRPEDTLDLGLGHQLQFITVPTPRWPDGLCTLDHATSILYTDKLFAMHYCGDDLWDTNWQDLDGDRRYYFDCLHAPQARQVESILERLSLLPAQCYAPGHGPLVKFSLSRILWDYRQWCREFKKRELQVVIIYASAYGNTTTIAHAITQGLIKGGVGVTSFNGEATEPQDIARAVSTCDGFILGSPTLAGHAPVQMETALGVVLSSVPKTKLAGVFGSYGWSGEAVDLMATKLKDANYAFGFEPIRVRFTPTDEILQQCQEAGLAFAQTLKKKQQQQIPRSGISEAQEDRTLQAVSRVIGSLCVITTVRGENHHGFLSSWISQATFNPPGIMIALAPSQSADLLIHPGDRFVINILKEGRNLRRYFSDRTLPGENPFITLEHRSATNGCLILEEALAYLECTVQNTLPTGDCYLVYATINEGEVLSKEGTTAILHRRSAQYGA
jgi:flavorubredoxin/flavin reductase (DIM6/NTAB) family NADH-FMN oxidoreductase RutF